MHNFEKKYNELRALYKQIIKDRNHYKKLSEQDRLAAIYNRFAFLERAEILHDRAGCKIKPSCMLFVDCDDFGKINKKYGHAAGDLAIQQVVQAIQSVMRKDAIIGRFGGDEIMIFVPSAGHRAMQSCAQRIVDGVPQKTKQSVTVSVGGAYGYVAVKNLIADAEKNMRKAKKMGGNQYAI